MLGLHDHRHAVDPCMWCLFPVHRDQPSGAERVAEHLGLPVDLLAQADAILTDAHLETDSGDGFREPGFSNYVKRSVM